MYLEKVFLIDFQPKLPAAAGNRNTIIFPIDHNAFWKLKQFKKESVSVF